MENNILSNIAIICLIGISCIALITSVELRSIRNAFNEETGNYVKAGFYPQGAIILHTSKKNMQELNQTIHHEYLHYLIREDYEHFCEEK